jgi:hypothetical protein
MNMKRSYSTLKRIPGLLSISGFHLASATAVLAQEKRESGLVSQSQTSVFEYILIAALFGLALYAICRTSYRS